MHYTFLLGTSMATPHVAGVAALVWSQYPQDQWDDPGLYLEVKDRILSTVRKVHAFRLTEPDGMTPGPTPVVTEGVLNARDAIFPPVLPSPDPKNRYLSFRVPGHAGPVAIRVKMLDLQNPVPGNANPSGPCCPPPNFTYFDEAFYGVCKVNPPDQSESVGYRCTEGADCPAPSDFCSGLYACNEPAFAGPPQQGSCARWVGKPFKYLESRDGPSVGSFTAARLQCTPQCHDWPSSGAIHVTGAEILPSSTYQVEVFACNPNNEPILTQVSRSVTITTRRHGDVFTPFNPPSTTPQPEGVDVAAVVNKFKTLPGAIVKSIAQVQPNTPNLNSDVDASDIGTVVDAAKSFAYPYSGPCPCPSRVTCNATPCRSTSQCKVCVGGTNDGVLCTGDENCPQGYCGDRTCVGGQAPGVNCTFDDQCAGGRCVSQTLCIRTCVSGLTGKVCGETPGAPPAADLDCGECSSGPRAGAPCIPFNPPAQPINYCDEPNGSCTTGVCGEGTTAPTSGFCRDRCGRCN